jgi:hypothetical protein
MSTPTISDAIRRDRSGRAVGLDWSAIRTPETAGLDELADLAEWIETAERVELADQLARLRAEADQRVAAIREEIEAAERKVEAARVAVWEIEHVTPADLVRFELVTATALRVRHPGGVLTEWSAADGWACSCGRRGASSTACEHVVAVMSRVGWRTAERMSVQARYANATPHPGGAGPKP